MKLATRGVIVVVMALGCAAGLVWLFKGDAAAEVVVGNANVAGGVAGVMALAAAVLVMWPQAAGCQAGTAGLTVEQTQAAVEYLAAEILRYWRAQAKDRRITTPSPASVCWQWASQDIAVPAGQLQSALLTAGVVTQLREQPYQHLDQHLDRSRLMRMVLLGGPGAGKTAAMLLLLIDILEQRPKGSREPVPVWPTLGGWNPDTTSLHEWAATTLARDYPGLAATVYGGPGTAAELIRTGRVALFLDGLDEIPPLCRAGRWR